MFRFDFRVSIQTSAPVLKIPPETELVPDPPVVYAGPEFPATPRFEHLYGFRRDETKNWREETDIITISCSATSYSVPEKNDKDCNRFVNLGTGRIHRLI